MDTGLRGGRIRESTDTVVLLQTHCCVSIRALLCNERPRPKFSLECPVDSVHCRVMGGMGCFQDMWG